MHDGLPFKLPPHQAQTAPSHHTRQSYPAPHETMLSIAPGGLCQVLPYKLLQKALSLAEIGCANQWA